MKFLFHFIIDIYVEFYPNFLFLDKQFDFSFYLYYLFLYIFSFMVC